ncbi:serine/threonine kinase family protein [Anopheles sinensis]|uniref:Serine/threonine kinase family protein n=1 Tax=Anopheles sinensis TaxID=74873 RepID=A0A084WFM3_ANOSI|nr:serine/threonine kinase family protein [Anopheles sinensis]
MKSGVKSVPDGFPMVPVRYGDIFIIPVEGYQADAPTPDDNWWRFDTAKELATPQTCETPQACVRACVCQHKSLPPFPPHAKLAVLQAVAKEIVHKFAGPFGSRLSHPGARDYRYCYFHEFTFSSGTPECRQSKDTRPQNAALSLAGANTFCKNLCIVSVTVCGAHMTPLCSSQYTSSFCS